MPHVNKKPLVRNENLIQTKKTGPRMSCECSEKNFTQNVEKAAK